MFCFYCIQLIYSGKGIAYTYTQTIGGTTTGVITTLSGLTLVTQLVNGLLSNLTSYAFKNNSDNSDIGAIGEAQINGTTCCRFHLRNLITD